MENQTILNAELSDRPGFELTRLDKELQLMESRSRAQFALSPVGQALKQFEVNQRMGQMYAASNIVPRIYQGNAANCAIAVDMAIRMNANPVMVMQNLYIVNGHPAWSSKFLIATVNTSGRFEPLRFEFFTDGKIGRQEYYETEYRGKDKVQVKKSFDGTGIDNLCCVAYTCERGSKTELKSSVVSCRLAVQEGWWTKNQSKWPTMTEQMLRYRAAAFWISAYAPEYAMGFRTEEEVRDITDTTYVDLTAGDPPTTSDGPSHSETNTEEATADVNGIALLNAKKAAAKKAEAQPEQPEAAETADEEQTADSIPADIPENVDPVTGELFDRE